MKLLFAFFASASACKELGSGSGFLTVELIKCENLENLDDSGVSDPYAILQLVNSPNKKQEESDVKDEKINPIWEKNFTFNVTNEKYLEVEIKDKDPVSRDESFGKFTIPFREDEGYKTYPLFGTGATCKVRIEFKVTRKLEVSKIKCENLEDLDDLWNKSDPYLKIWLDSFQDSQEQTSKTKESNFNPEWKDEEFHFKVLKETELIVQVWDYDELSPDDKYGKFTVPFMEKPGTNTHKLKNPNGEYSNCEVTTKLEPLCEKPKHHCDLEECEKPNQRSGAQKDCPETFSLGNGNTIFRADNMGQEKTHQAQCAGSEEIIVDMEEKIYDGKIFVSCQDGKWTTETDPKVSCKKKEVASPRGEEGEEDLRAERSLAAPPCYSCWRVALLVTLM